MHKKAILYSIEDISIWNLKKLKKISLDEKKVKNFLSYCDKHNIKALYGDEVFLKKTKPVPLIVYYMWDYNLIKNKIIIGVVGPRKMTNFIKKYLDYFFQSISKFQNITVVSWLAEWTDQYAHKLSLKYNIPTIWVLGYGIANWLNWKQRYLIKDIIDKNWLIISQFPLKQAWTKWTFPLRNKIIAGISDFLFVPQAEEKSWSLITITEALKINIPVYSCFSSIEDDMWKWTNKLISESKVYWVYDMDIFIDNLNKKFKFKKEESNNIDYLTVDEKLIYESIQKGYDSLESICFYTKKSVDEVLNILSMLELEWLISSDWEKYFTY